MCTSRATGFKRRAVDESRPGRKVLPDSRAVYTGSRAVPVSLRAPARATVPVGDPSACRRGVR